MKKVFTLFAAFILGLIFSNMAFAQFGVLNRDHLRPDMLSKIKLTPQPQNRPSINPGVLSKALNSPVDLGRIERINPALNLPGTLNKPSLPDFGLRPVDPIPQGLLDLPPGMTLRPIHPPAPIPHAEPQPMPSPRPGGPTIQFGPGGPSVSFGDGPTINIPLGRPGRRFRQPGFHSPPQVLGYGPNGQVHTGDATVHGSTFTPGRNISQHNGTARQVQQPIYDQFGNLTGYQTGTVWQNSITGQQHGNMTRYTPNGTGGTHQSTTLYSTAGGNITPRGN